MHTKDGQDSAQPPMRFPLITLSAPRLALMAVLVAAFQVVTLWHWGGDKVDESEIVHFAIGFFGGDLDPKWQGYGHLPMYLLFLVYAALGSLPVALGVFSDFGGYTMQVFESGVFFQIARHFFAFVGVMAAVLYAYSLRALGVHWLVWIGFFLVCVTSSDAVVYANYLRVDQWLGLFSAILVVLSLRPLSRGVLVGMCATVAAAIACKISAVTLAAVPAVASVIALRKGIINGYMMVALVVFSGLLMWALQPFMNPLEVAEKLISRHIGAESIQLTKTNYTDLGARTQVIFGFLYDRVGWLVMSGLLLAPWALWRNPRLLWIVGILALLMLPYVVATRLSEYWFLPVYNLVRLIAFFSVGMLLQSLGSRALRHVGVALVMAGVMVTVIRGWDHYVGFLKHARKPNNVLMAKRWLEDQVVGTRDIYLEGAFSWVVPKIYDVTDPGVSKHISRAFIYQRHQNEYLNSLFERYLYERYAPALAVFRESPGLGSVSVRIDVPSGKGWLQFDGACSHAGKACAAGKLVRQKHINLEADPDGRWQYSTTGDDPYVVYRFASDAITPATGWLNFEWCCDGSAEVRIYFEGFETPARFRHGAGHTYRAHMYSKMPVRGIQRVHPGTVDPRELGEGRRPLFVTSPSAYNRFLKLNADEVPSGDLDRLSRIVEYYEHMISQPVVARFTSGASSPVEVYDLGAVSGTSDTAAQ